MKKVLAFVLAAACAYALSFSADLVFGTIARVYPLKELLLAILWWIIASFTGLTSLSLARGKVFAIPFVLITLIAGFGGIVGHRYNLAVAAVMAFASLCAWQAGQHPKAVFTNDSES